MLLYCNTLAIVPNTCGERRFNYSKLQRLLPALSFPSLASRSPLFLSSQTDHLFLIVFDRLLVSMLAAQSQKRRVYTLNNPKPQT